MLTPRRLVPSAALLAVLLVAFGYWLGRRHGAAGRDVPPAPELAVDAVRVDAPASTPKPSAPARARELAPPSAERLAEYAAREPKTVLELQLYRESTSMPFETADGGAAEATLINLNPRVNAWFVLRLELPLASAAQAVGDDHRYAIYHLENPDPEGAELALDEAHPRGLVIRKGGGETRCDLWGSPPVLAEARASGKTFAELCGGRLTLRNPTEGRRTRLEMATDLLRDSVWGGEKITTFVRQNLYQDRYLETSKLFAAADAVTADRSRPPGAPPRPLIDPRYDGQALEPAELGLELDSDTPGRVLAGRWYAVRDQPGVFVNTLLARLVAPEVTAALKGRLNPLDEVESSALVYLVAFDLAAFDVGFALGTDHPRVGWSERALPAVRDDSLPGPDGIGTVAPLARTGSLSPAAARRVEATFTAGFKRSHGAFKHTALATSNSGSHYGFVENGAVASKLVPGLATAIVWDDGTVELKTWDQGDDASIGRVRHARQNGVPLIETGADGVTKPGALVPRWGEGNWSGSQDKRLRSLRAGLCWQVSPADGDGAEDGETGERRFLMYGYFSGATPSAMAQVFHAAGCRYAMLLDMNALEHTYLALYQRRDDRFLIQHLIEGMNVLDESVGGQQLPRFVAFADNRDFFYLLRREDPR